MAITSPPIMHIQLNGSLHEIATETSVTDLLVSIGLGAKPVVVEINEQAVFPRDYPQTTISEGARIEIVMLAAGG